MFIYRLVPSDLRNRADVVCNLDLELMSQSELVVSNLALLTRGCPDAAGASLSVRLVISR